MKTDYVSGAQGKEQTMKINGKECEPYILCSDCGYAVKRSKMFVKSYNHTAICLCKKCARKLAEEINDKYLEEGK